MTTLDQMRVGARATVAEIDGFDDVALRLMEMGLLVGTPVELVRFAPMGDPVEIKVRGYHLTLRRHEAEVADRLPRRAARGPRRRCKSC